MAARGLDLRVHAIPERTGGRPAPDQAISRSVHGLRAHVGQRNVQGQIHIHLIIHANVFFIINLTARLIIPIAFYDDI